MIFLKQYVSLIFLFSMTISAVPWVTSTLDLTFGLPKLGLGPILGGSSFPDSAHVIQPGKSSMGKGGQTQNTLDDMKSELDEIKKTMTRLYDLVQQLSEGGIYTTKVGVSKPIITDSSIKIETKEMREKNKFIPRDCSEVLKHGYNISGVYQIQPFESQKPFMVLCDMDTRDGGWTHIQKRFDGSVDFYQGWREYKIGFGDLLGEFWIGLEHIRWLTSTTHSQLLIELVDRDNVTRYAQYDAFGIGTEQDGYRLDVLSGYSGDAGDSLTDRHRGMKFTTVDFDQDLRKNGNCAESENGGWWFNACGRSNLNGQFINLNDESKGVQWQKSSKPHSYSKVRMLVKPA